MYDLNQYVKDALRTESVVEEVKLDPELLAGVLQLFIASGNMLDQIKKHAFYNRDYDAEKFVGHFMNVVGALDQLKPAISDMGKEDKELTVDVNPRLFHAITGAATESTELVEAMVAAFNGEEMDTVNLLEEFGDLNWYQAIAIDALDGDFGNMLDTNIGKLKTRYPEKYDNTKANIRDLTAEREILQANPLKD